MDEILSLLGSLLQAGSSIYTATQSNQQAQTAEQQRNQQYTQLNDLVNNPDKLLANIMAMKRSLTAEEKNMITQTVVGQLAASGQGGAPGIINAAIDYALQQADAQLFNQAATAYLGALGLPLQALRSQVPASLYPTAGAAAGSFSGAGNSASAFLAAVKKALAAKPASTGLSGSSDPGIQSSEDPYFQGMNLGPGIGYTPSSDPSAFDIASSLTPVSTGTF